MAKHRKKSLTPTTHLPAPFFALDGRDKIEIRLLQDGTELTLHERAAQRCSFSLKILPS
jgi:hypothetical protein